MPAANESSEFVSEQEPLTFDPVINDVIVRILELEKVYNELTEQHHTDVMTTDLREGLMDNINEEIKYLYGQLQSTWDAIPDMDTAGLDTMMSSDEAEGLYIGDDPFIEEVIVNSEPVADSSPKKRKPKAKK